VIVGLVLLVASLLLGTASPASHWRLGLATALIVATVLYWTGTTCAMAVLLRETIDPKRFSDKIVTGAATRSIGTSGTRSSSPKTCTNDCASSGVGSAP
jgi:hypothetical protein